MAIIALAFCIAPCTAQDANTAAPSVPIMKVDEIEPGMTGYGLSVFQGTRPEKFDVKILGRVANNWPETDMIVAELSHPVLKDIGVVAGMSGSPIYIDGKLIGAVSYGWGFSIRPIAGVTPIEKMIEVMDLTTEEAQLSPHEWREGVQHWPEARAALGLPPANKLLDPIMVPQSDMAAMGISGMTDPSGFVTFQPLAMPLTISTRSPIVMDQAKKFFQGTGLMPVASAAGGSSLGDPKYADEKLEPGSAFSVMLIEGDLHIAGTGTATYFTEDKMVGFGHAMNGFGAVDAPTAVAEIVTVMPTLQFPFKLGYPVKELGALRQDRLFAVGVSLNATSTMTPVTFRVRHDGLNLDETHNYRVWKHRFYLPGLSYLCMLESIGVTSTLDGPLSVEMDYRIALSDGRTLKKKHYFSNEFSAMNAAAMAMAEEIAALQSNRFKPVDIVSIDGTLQLSELQHLMVQQRVVRSKTRVFPGDSVEATVSYARWREGEVELPIKVEIPAELEPGEYQLYVTDGPTRAELEKSFRPELRAVEDLDDLIESMEPTFPEDQVYVLLVDQKDRMVVRRQRLEELPSSVAAITEATSRDPQLTYRSKGSLISEKRLGYEARVAGSTVIPVTVEKP